MLHKKLIYFINCQLYEICVYKFLNIFQLTQDIKLSLY